MAHKLYAAGNKKHLAEYARERRVKVWGESSRELAHRAELLALDKLLPSLGFTKIFHASAVRRFVPFDFVATRDGIRYLIDVTTSYAKGRQATALELTRALEMPLLRVFIKPDFTGYMVRNAQDRSRVLLNQVKPLPK